MNAPFFKCLRDTGQMEKLATLEHLLTWTKDEKSRRNNWSNTIESDFFALPPTGLSLSITLSESRIKSGSKFRVFRGYKLLETFPTFSLSSLHNHVSSLDCIGFNSSICTAPTRLYGVNRRRLDQFLLRYVSPFWILAYLSNNFFFPLALSSFFDQIGSTYEVWGLFFWRSRWLRGALTV